MPEQIPKEAQAKFVKAGYRLVGTHSAVEICHWTKESLRKGRACYKEKWYGIRSHRCLEMSPALTWCTHKCKFCWRPLQFTVSGEPRPDDPKRIIDGCIDARKLLLMGFGGQEKVDKKKFKEALDPTSVAISLAGEPTLYPMISELIEEFGRRKMKSFLVTNGTRPDRLKGLRKEPTNLYVSLCAPDKATYEKVCGPLVPGGWERVNESLHLMKSFGCTKVVRMTLVNGLNLSSPEKYSEIITEAEPDFVEAKSYSWVGDSRQRMPGTSVIPMDELKGFAGRLAEAANYKIKGIDESSRVVLLARQ